MKATWTKDKTKAKDKKNEGDFLLRIVLKPRDPDVSSGTQVTVLKKDGTTQLVTIDRVLWAGGATEKDHEFDPDVKRGDVMVLAKAQPREKKSARAMLEESARRPETDEPSNDDIPF